MSSFKSEVVRDFDHRPMFVGSEQILCQLLWPLVSLNYLDNPLIDQFSDLGLIPLRLVNSLEMLKFIGATVLHAQQAQRKFGVPASVLIAMAAYESSVDAQVLAGDISFATGCNCCLPSTIEEWFMKRAEQLSSSPEFKEALPLAAQPKLYLKRLCELGFFTDHLDMKDVLSYLEDNDLQECDLAGELRAGEYSRKRYSTWRDTDGQVRFRPALLMSELREEIAACKA